MKVNGGKDLFDSCEEQTEIIGISSDSLDRRSCYLHIDIECSSTEAFHQKKFGVCLLDPLPVGSIDC